MLIWAGILFLQSIFFALFDWWPYCDTKGLPTIILIAAIVIGTAALFIRKKRDTVNKIVLFLLIIALLILGFILLLPDLSHHRIPGGNAMVYKPKQRNTAGYQRQNERNLQKTPAPDKKEAFNRQMLGRWRIGRALCLMADGIYNARNRRQKKTTG